MKNCPECKRKQQRIDQLENLMDRMKVSAEETHQRITFIETRTTEPRSYAGPRRRRPFGVIRGGKAGGVI